MSRTLPRRTGKPAREVSNTTASLIRNAPKDAQVEMVQCPVLSYQCSPAPASGRLPDPRCDVNPRSRRSAGVVELLWLQVVDRVPLFVFMEYGDLRRFTLLASLPRKEKSPAKSDDVDLEIHRYLGKQWHTSSAFRLAD